MLHCFDFFRNMDLLAITCRLVLALLCGGIIGIEREIKRRPAGFRTHILICMGSAITILTNLYLYQVMHLFTDISRMGAQVIVGVSFVGAGTIIVTRHQKIKGLTTAAGLWAAAIIGLACGVVIVLEHIRADLIYLPHTQRRLEAAVEKHFRAESRFLKTERKLYEI